MADEAQETIYFSPSDKGFYSSRIHAADKIPADKIAITSDLHAELLQGEVAGKIIGLDSHGRPAALDKPFDIAAKKTVTDNYRREKEISGFDFNGIHIPSDEKTERRIIGATIKAQNDPNYEIADWTTDGGQTVIALTAEMILEIGDMFDKHIQSCFTAQVTVISRLQNYDTAEAITEAFDVQYDFLMGQ